MHSTYFQFGHLHVPVFGVVIAVGLMAALALTQKTARYAGLDADAVWNAGMTAIVAAFVISRLLLVVFNLKSFLEYPLLMLALPSLTSTGVLLTGIFMFGYVRWRGLPVLRLLDAMAPSAAVLWAFGNVGYLLDGTRDGMPVAVASGAQPVEAYTLVAALLLTIALLVALRSGYRVGAATGFGLLAGGLAVFFIDFFRLPSELVAGAWIDPAQIIGVALILVGGGLLYGVARGIAGETKAYSRG